MLVVIVSLGRLIVANWSSPRFMWPAVALDLAAIAALAALIAQIALALKIDYDQPVAVDSKSARNAAKGSASGTSKGSFSPALLAWMPLFILVMKRFLGVDVYRLLRNSWIVTTLPSASWCWDWCLGCQALWRPHEQIGVWPAVS